MLRATVSGSFHRHMPAIYDAVGTLRELGVDVLSPSDPRVVDNIGEFLFVASDKLRSIKLVQDRHFECIRASDFLWVVCPDGYTGASTSAEIGAAYAAGVPVFSDAPALDITLGQYVQRVPSARVLVERMSSRQPTPASLHVLVDAKGSIDHSIESLARVQSLLLGKTGNGRDDAERGLDSARQELAKSLNLRVS